MDGHIKIGLTLSGGGSKGIAHIGVLRALIENGIKPEIISGTSAGSIVGAMYASGKTPDEIEQAINDSNLIKIFRVIGMPGAGLVKLDYLRQRLSENIAEDSFEGLQMPLYICATNLNYGKPVIFHSGTLFDKVVASCAVPWLFKPVLIDGQLYADGGITNNFPAGAIRDKCDILIGCNVKPKLIIEENKNLDTLMGISQRCVDLSLWTNSKPNVKLLDVYIAPEKVTTFSFFSIRRTKELCDVGYEETMKHMPKIKQLIAAKNDVPAGVSHTAHQPQQLRG